MSQLTDFFKNKKKKNSEYNIDNIDLNNTSFGDIASNFEMTDEDLELGRAIYNKEMSLGAIDRAKTQAQQGIQNQYSLRNKYQNYLREQNGLDSSVAAVQSGDLSLRSKLLSQMGAVNNNALNSTLVVNQDYYDTEREITSRYDAERQSNYANWMADTSGEGDNLQNIVTSDTTYRYDSAEDIAIAQNDYSLAKEWLEKQDANKTLTSRKISELKEKLVQWENKINESKGVEYLGTKNIVSGMGGAQPVESYRIAGKTYKFSPRNAVAASTVGLSEAEVGANKGKLIHKNGKSYLVTERGVIYEIKG